MPQATSTDVLIGAGAGLIATIPMTMAMEGLHLVLPGEPDSPFPPREIIEGLYEHLGADDDIEDEHLGQMTFLLHYAYGGIAGAMFPFVAPRRLPAAIGAGVVYGLAVWSGSYRGLLPATGVRHHARHDTARRTAMMIAAHVVWGATLGLVLRGRSSPRTASADPDAAER